MKKKLDMPSGLVFHGTTFQRDFAGIYRNEKLGQELYLDTCLHRKGPIGGSDQEGPCMHPAGGDELLKVLDEVALSQSGGEVVVRTRNNSGRIYIHRGRVAWVATSRRRTSLARLVAGHTRNGLEDLKAVVQTCRRSGDSPFEMLVDRGLIDVSLLRRLFLRYISSEMFEIFSWNCLQSGFYPGTQTYRSSLTFELNEVYRGLVKLGFSSRPDRGPGDQPPYEQQPATARMATAPVAAARSAEAGATTLGKILTRAGNPTAALHGTTSEPRMRRGLIRNEGTTTNKYQGGTTMNKYLEDLREVDGFIAAGAFTAEGELLTEVTNGNTLVEMGALANDVLLKSQKAAEIMGVGRGNMVHISAPEAQILVRCLNENVDFGISVPGHAHVHMVLVLAPGGNLALGKIRLEKALHNLAPELR